MSSYNLSIVLPCYNEEKNLPLIFSSVDDIISNEMSSEILLVDNGSSDNSNALISEYCADKHGVNLVTVHENKGYGFGIMQGVLQANGDIISWTHADLQTDLQDVLDAYSKYSPELLAQKSVLKGRRVGRNLFDAFFTFGMSVVSSVMMNTYLSDVNAQPKMFHRSFLKHLKTYPHDFSLDLFLLYQAKQLGYKIIEYPVRFKKRLHGEAKGGGSLKGKIKLIKRTFQYINELSSNTTK